MRIIIVPYLVRIGDDEYQMIHSVLEGRGYIPELDPNPFTSRMEVDVRFLSPTMFTVTGTTRRGSLWGYWQANDREYGYYTIDTRTDCLFVTTQEAVLEQRNDPTLRTEMLDYNHPQQVSFGERLEISELERDYLREHYANIAIDWGDNTGMTYTST